MAYATAKIYKDNNKINLEEHVMHERNEPISKQRMPIVIEKVETINHSGNRKKLGFLFGTVSEKDFDSIRSNQLCITTPTKLFWILHRKLRHTGKNKTLKALNFTDLLKHFPIFIRMPTQRRTTNLWWPVAAIFIFPLVLRTRNKQIEKEKLRSWEIEKNRKHTKATCTSRFRVGKMRREKGYR
ncbi:unnamed protein product [Mytilus edulis]|uniref:Uncharacterized protein n=1 Tax=Mytilus edulis TaxID=6550 RepID=A0A8S3TXS0_MYTED|nr:unnamed protein product [Mytilus edulis]